MVEKKLVKRTIVNIPRSIEEASDFIADIGKHQRELIKIEMELNEDIEEIKARAVANGLPHQEAIDQRLDGIFIFAERNRDSLTEQGKKKTVHFPTGDISWRMTPPSVLLKSVKRVIELCKALKLERFIRVKEEIDKKAMLKEPEVACQIEGVTIDQEEEFIVKPAELNIEIPRSTKKLQKLLPKK